MNKTIKEKLERWFKLYEDLIEFLSEDALAEKLPGLPSNELGQQLWCVVGARNSYLKALKAGEWKGFDSPHLHHKLYGQTAGRGQIACMGYLQFSIEYASVLNGGGRTQSSAIVHSYHDRTVYANCE